jgi:hypothetical protein
VWANEPDGETAWSGLCGVETDDERHICAEHRDDWIAEYPGEPVPDLRPVKEWEWTCAECGEGGTLPDDFDAFRNEARRHTSGHAAGPFDTIPQIIMEAVR